MPSSAPQPPHTLHLVRLAKATPNRAVALPGLGLRALHLTAPYSERAGGAALCLESELLIDFENGAFVHLRIGEACALPLPYRLLPARGSCTALLLGAADVAVN